MNHFITISDGVQRHPFLLLCPGRSFADRSLFTVRSCAAGSWFPVRSCHYPSQRTPILSAG